MMTNLHIEHQTSQKNQTYESERQRKERQERDSIMLMADQQIKLQQMAEQYMESEAKCSKDYEICVGGLRKDMASREKALTLEEQKDISIPLVQALTSLHKTALPTHPVHQSAPPAGPAPSSKPAEDRGSRVPGGVVVEARVTDAQKGKKKRKKRTWWHWILSFRQIQANRSCPVVACVCTFNHPIYTCDSLKYGKVTCQSHSFFDLVQEQKDRDEVSCIVTGCLYLTNFRGKLKFVTR